MKCFVRVWKEFDSQDIEQHLIVVGELSAECYSCRKIGIDKKSAQCPGCGVPFKYMGFRRKLEFNVLRKLREELPAMIFIDFDDFKKAVGSRDARKLLDI